MRNRSAYHPSVNIAGIGKPQTVGPVRSNMSLERTVKQRGPRLAAASASWPAAQLGR